MTIFEAIYSMVYMYILTKVLTENSPFFIAIQTTQNHA